MASRLGVFIEKHGEEMDGFFLSILVAYRLYVAREHPLKHFS